MTKVTPEELKLKRKQFQSLKYRKSFRNALSEKFEQQGHKCFYCSAHLMTEFEFMESLQGPIQDSDLDRIIYLKNNTYHIEHMIPLSRGGTNDIHNLVFSCTRCNSQKGDKLLPNFNSSIL